MVPCDQSREQCSATAKSPHHLSIPWFACISFFSSKYFPPQTYSSLSSLWVCNVPVHFVALYTHVRCVANNAEGKDLVVQEVPLYIQHWLWSMSAPQGSLCIHCRRGTDISLHPDKKLNAKKKTPHKIKISKLSEHPAFNIQSQAVKGGIVKQKPGRMCRI